jgi:hypothetical protein
MFTVPMSNERIIKIVSKHKVITSDIPLPCHVIFAVFLYCGSF